MGRKIFVSSLGLAVFGALCYGAGTQRMMPTTLDATTLDFDVDSGYGQPPSIRSGFYSGIITTVEPHRTSTFSLISPVGSTFVWSIAAESPESAGASQTFDSTAFARQADTDKVEAGAAAEPTFDAEGAVTLDSTGTVATHDFKSVAGKRFLVTAYCASTGEKATKVVHGKYVRREIRSLSDADRELYLDAIRVLYSTDTKTGSSLYGEQFKGHDWYSFSHIGPLTLNSRWHNSPSFFPAHAAFQSAFEVSMQLVHPSTCLCYWDFLYDSETYAYNATSGSGGWAASEVWSSEWFGPMPFTPDGSYETTTISNTEKALTGRWSDVFVPRNASTATGANGEVGVCHNSYGFARNPYNNNPSKHATRDFSICGLKTTDMDLPGCKELLGCFRADTFNAFHASTEFVLHESFHTKLGGAWECGYNLRHLQHTMVSTDMPDAAAIVAQLAMTLMDLWRQAFYFQEIKTPEACLLSEDFSSCQAYCADLESSLAAVEGFDETTVVGNWHGDDFGALDADKWDLLFRTKVLPFLSSEKTPALDPNTKLGVNPDTGRYYFTQVGMGDEATTLELVKASVVGVCRPGKISEFMDPMSSASDPIFMPLHAMFERVWQYMRVSKNLESTWSGHGNDDDDSSVNGTASLHFNPVGWELDDPQAPFTEVYGTARLPVGSTFTNRELVALFEPARTEMPYVFDETSFRVCTE